MANPSGEEYGGFLARLFAFICDQLIASALFYLVFAAMLKAGFGFGALTILMFIVPALYYAAMQSSSGQATIGKSLLGLKVATVGGDRASFLRNLGREFAKIISAIPLMIGFIMAAFTGRKQALHDMVASTVVLDVGPAKVLKGAVVVVFAFIANGAIAGFMLQDAYEKFMQETMGGMMAEMQGAQGGLPPGMPPMKGVPSKPAPTVTPVAPKVVVTPAPPPQTMAVAPAAPKAASTPAPQATSAPAPQSAPVMVARAEPAKPMPAMAPRAVAQAPAPKPAAAEPPAAETPPALPSDMPARVNSAPAAAASAPAAASTPEAAKDVPPPAMRPGVPGPKYNDLMTAVLNRDASGVNELLAFGKWVDKPDSRGVTPLMIAVRNGDAEIAEALLKAGADPSRNAMGGESSAKIAAARRDAAMTALLERYTMKR